MQFNSLIFIFLFLPLTVSGWRFLKKIGLHKAAIIWMVLMSSVFLGYANILYLLLLFISIVINYSISDLMDRFQKISKVFLIIGIACNILFLGYFKYRNFFVANVNTFCGTSFLVKSVILPLGISFFTLQQIAYLVDRYRCDAPHYDFLRYSAFVMYFPKLISGPIPYHNELIKQFDNDLKDGLVTGLLRFIFGLAKKVLIADLLEKYVEYSLSHIFSLDFITSWMTAVAFTLELYYDFSGYCDMAVGVSMMMGIEIPENFDSPYKAKSIKEFWKRWHITLTRFLTKYIYIPLGGNREGTVRWIANTLIVFLISGLWHGASWNYVLWGLLHGIAILLSNLLHKKWKENWLSHIVTILFVIFAWTIFRIEDFNLLKIFVGKMLRFSYSSFLVDWCSVASTIPEMYVVSKVLASNWKLLSSICVFLTLTFMGISVAFLHGNKIPDLIEIREKRGYSKFFLITVALIFTWCVISLSEVSTFLYFTF